MLSPLSSFLLGVLGGIFVGFLMAEWVRRALVGYIQQQMQGNGGSLIRSFVASLSTEALKGQPQVPQGNQTPPDLMQGLGALFGPMIASINDAVNKPPADPATMRKPVPEDDVQVVRPTAPSGPRRRRSERSTVKSDQSQSAPVLPTDDQGEKKTDDLPVKQVETSENTTDDLPVKQVKSSENMTDNSATGHAEDSPVDQADKI